MNIENLKPGMILKNYKELCKVLEINPTGGNEKKSQIKELERYVSYHKEGNKFVINEVYNEVKEKMDKRTNGNNNDLSKNLRYMILHLCHKNKLRSKVEIGYSKTFLYSYCGMINENYRDTKGNKKAFAQYLNLEQLAIEECFEYTDERMNQALRRALSSLTSTNKALGYRYGYNYVLSSIKHHVTADIDEETIIRDVENKIMKQMQISRYDKIYGYGRWDEFKFKVINTLKEEHPLYFKNLKYYYNVIVLNYKDTSIKRTMKGFEESFKLDYTSAKANVNKYFSKSLDGTITRRHEKNKVLTSENLNEKNIYRGSKNYVKEQKKAKNTIVKDEVQKVDFKLLSSFDLDDESVICEQLNINNIPF